MTFDIDRAVTESIWRTWVERDPDYGDNAKYIDPNAPRSPAPPQSPAAKVPPLEAYDMDDPGVRRKDFVRRLVDRGYDRDIVEKKADCLMTKGYTPEDFEPRVRPGDKTVGERTGWTVPSVTGGQGDYRPPYPPGTLSTPPVPPTQGVVTLTGDDIPAPTVSSQAEQPAQPPRPSEPGPSVREMQAEEERRHKDFMKEISPVRGLLGRFRKADGEVDKPFDIDHAVADRQPTGRFGPEPMRPRDGGQRR